jgi:hypothetical protein
LYCGLYRERIVLVRVVEMVAVKSSNKSAELPLYAQLAFAARCARRVVNLFRLQSNHPELAACCKSLGTAVRLTESFAAGDDLDANDLAIAETGMLRAVVAAGEMNPPNRQSAAAAKSAYAALCAVKAALELQGGQSPEDGANRVVEAVKIARDAAASADENVTRPIRHDSDQLRQLALGRFPDFGEPIDPSENGLLGPLFQDFSRGAPRNTQQTGGGAAGADRYNSGAAGPGRSGRPSEFGDSSTSDWARQIEKRAEELAARQEELDDRETEIARRQEELDEELRKQQQALTDSRLKLEAERDAARAAFESLEEERRAFLEQRLHWNPASPGT